MAKDHKKPDLKKPKFNSYWIYAAIVVVFIGLNLFGGGSWSHAFGGATFLYLQDDAWGGVATDHVKLWTLDMD